MSSARILKLIHALGMTASAKRLKKHLARFGLWPKSGFGYGHRNAAYHLLEGRGLEIGASHCPASLPARCKIEYCDAHSRQELEKLFPEIEPKLLVDVDHIVNLDEDRLDKKVAHPYDFVIINHVIEHVANPLSVIEQLFGVIRPGGKLLISAPDKEFNFDKQRKLTSFDHLQEEYRQGVIRVEDDHYLDFICHTAPAVFNSGDAEQINAALMLVRDRREHAHVWNTESFLDFLQQALAFLYVDATLEYVSRASANNFECFVVLKKVSG